MLGFIPRPGEIFRVDVRGGRTRLVRGRISPSLLSELEGAAGAFPHARGRIVATHDGYRVRLTVASLPAELEDHVRDVFGPHATRLTKDATIHAPARGAGGGTLAVVLLAFSGLLGVSVLFTLRLTSGEAFGDPSEAEARSIGREVALELPDVARRAREFDRYVAPLRAAGVLPLANGPEDDLLVASGPEYALMLSPRLVAFSVAVDRPSWTAMDAAELERQLRALRFADVHASCDASAGCTLSAGPLHATLVSSGEWRLPRPLPECVAARIALRLGAFLRSLQQADPQGRELVLISTTPGFQGSPFFGPGDGQSVDFVFLTEPELRILAAWRAAYEGAPVREFGIRAPFESHLEPRCRSEALEH